MFDGGIRAVVRATSDTTTIDNAPLAFEKRVGSVDDIAYSGAWFIFMLTIGKIDYREKVQRLCEPRVFSHNEATECFGYNPMTFQHGVINEILEYREKEQI